MYKMTKMDGASLYAKRGLGRVYRTGEEVWANPKAVEKGYGLLVFEKLRDCSVFAPNWRNLYRVFRVGVEPKDRIKEMSHPISVRLLRGLGYFLGILLDTSVYMDNGWPDGTRMYRKLRVMEEV